MRGFKVLELPKLVKVFFWTYRFDDKNVKTIKHVRSDPDHHQNLHDRQASVVDRVKVRYEHIAEHGKETNIGNLKLDV